MLDPRDTYGPVPQKVTDNEIKLINERLFNFTFKRITYIDGCLRDEFSRAHNFIYYWPQGKVRMQSSINYFHYTSVENFKNIIRSGVFWASQLGAMNDPGELSYAKEKLLYQVSTLCSPMNIEKNTTSKINKNITTFFDRYIFKRLFCLSFSKRGNLSSQWSKYSCENGVSFSLNTQIIKSLSSIYNDVIFTDVIYDQSKQLEILRELAQEITKDYTLLIDEDSAHNLLQKKFEKQLTYITVAFKHNFYHEEEEYRVVIPINGNEMHLKTKPDGVSQYMNIDFMNIYKNNEDIDIPVEYIFTAPTSNERKALKNIYSILSNYKIKFGLIIGSGAPFIWPKK
ncbi:DUF2971 domain-containing protein [Klebsiella quasipneumoniae]